MDERRELGPSGPSRSPGLKAALSGSAPRVGRRPTSAGQPEAGGEGLRGEGMPSKAQVLTKAGPQLQDLGAVLALETCWAWTEQGGAGMLWKT